MVSYCSETPVTEVEENESESVPFLTCPMTETVGLMAEKTSEFSSYSSYISSASTVREEPRPVTETVSVFVPMSSNIEVTSPVMPCMRDTRMMTDATPMMMPSMVRKARILLPERLLKASLKACENPMRQSPLGKASCAGPSKIM